MSEPVKCAIYARYSSNNQREASIEDQIRKCREVAIAKGWVILNDHIYFDRARSGAASNSRDAFKEIMRVAMSSNCPFERILVDDTSRIARNTREALDVFSLLTFYGIYVYYVAQNIDTSHETAEEMITINGLIDSLYIRNLAKETHRGMEGQILKGFSGGGKRYGYYSEPVYNGKVDIYGNPEADGYRLKINHDEADTIIRIFSFFAEDGYSAKKIVNLLNEELKSTGNPKPPRGSFWGISTLLGNAKTLKGILNNVIYIGQYHWNRTSYKRNPHTGRLHRIKKSSDRWISIDRPELRILSDDLWQKAKSRQKHIDATLKGRYTKGRSLYSANLLTGLVTCQECGGNIAIVGFKKYGCSNHRNHGKAVCANNHKINKEIIEKRVIEMLGLQINRDESVNYLLTKVNKLIAEHFSQHKPVWKDLSLQDGLKKLNKEIENYIGAIRAGFISSIVRDHLQKAERKKLEFEKLIAESKKETTSVPQITASSIVQYLSDMHSTLNLHPVFGKLFLSSLIDKVLLHYFADSWSVKVLRKTLNDQHELSLLVRGVPPTT